MCGALLESNQNSKAFKTHNETKSILECATCAIFIYYLF